MSFKKILLIISIITISVVFASGQCLDGDCQEGQGILVDKDNHVWLGEFSNKKLVGLGVCHFSWGAKYVGDFQNGNFEGNGTYYHTDGTVEKGIWNNGILEKENPKKKKKKKKKAFKTKAIIIAIDNYSNQKLSFAVNDAEAIHKSLVGHTEQDLEATLLLNKQATVAEVNQQLDLIKTNSSKDEVILFFFLGTYKGSTIQLVDGELEIDVLKTALSKSSAHQKFCFLDLTQEKEEVYLAMKNANQAKSLVIDNDNLDVFLLKKEYESSIEFDGLRYGILTHYMMRSFSGVADKNMDGNITDKELFNFTSKALNDYSDGRLYLELLKSNSSVEKNLPVFSHTISD